MSDIRETAQITWEFVDLLGDILSAISHPLDEFGEFASRCRRQWVRVDRRPTDPQQHLRIAATSEDFGAHGLACFGRSPAVR